MTPQCNRRVAQNYRSGLAHIRRHRPQRLKGIRRTLGTATAQKAPALTDDVRAMVEAADAGLIGARDRALMLVGFAGAFRRSELVGLDVEDCAFGKDGLTITLLRSKTEGARLASRTDRILRRARCQLFRNGSH